MSLSGMNQRYNNANRGIVDQGKIKCVPLCTSTKVISKTGTS
jgi:hypothetical protein